MSVVLLGIWMAYAIGLLWVAFQLKPTYKKSMTDYAPRVTVLIPFRNEVRYLQLTLEAIARSVANYKGKAEVLLLNDHSDDGSEKMAREWCEAHTFAQFINLSPSATGKKQALAKGVATAQHDIILTTDADVEMEMGWIGAMVRNFEEEDVQMVCGPVTYIKPKNIVQHMLLQEFAALMGITQWSIQKGNALMSNGANLAFRKSAYEKVKGYEGSEHIATGDDVHLLQKIQKVFPQSICYQSAKEAVVKTHYPENLRVFWQQRKRWASKWKRKASINTVLGAVAVFLLHASWLFAIIFTCIGGMPWNILGLIFGLKALAEGVFLYRVLRSLTKPWQPMVFILLQILYSLYVVVFGIVANFGVYYWKGRKIKV